MDDNEKPTGAIKPVVANAHYATEYGDAFKKSQETGVCIFCAEFEKKDSQIVLIETSLGWWAKKNPFPPKGRDYQTVAEQAWLLMPQRHISEVEELGPRDWSAMGWLFQVITQRHAAGGALCMRFGDPYLSGRTLLHLHAQLIVPGSYIRPEDPTKIHESVDPIPFWVG